MKLTNLFAAAVVAASATTAAAQDAADWGGFYAGLTASSISWETNLGAPGTSFGGNGAGLGILLGYNHALSPSFIVGGELTYSFAESNLGVAPFTLKDEASLRLRGGYVMGETLLYGAVGYAQANIEAAPGVDGKGDGTVVAIGIEHMLKPNLTIRVEYSHTEYSDYPITILPPTWEDSTDAITVGVAYKF